MWSPRGEEYHRKHEDVGDPDAWDGPRHLSFYIPRVTLRHSPEGGWWTPDPTLACTPPQGKLLGSQDNCHAIYATKQNVTMTKTTTTSTKTNPTNKDSNTRNPLGFHTHIYLCIISIRSGAEVQTHTIPWLLPEVLCVSSPSPQARSELGLLLWASITHPPPSLIKTLVTRRRDHFLFSIQCLASPTVTSWGKDSVLFIHCDTPRTLHMPGT